MKSSRQSVRSVRKLPYVCSFVMTCDNAFVIFVRFIWTRRCWIANGPNACAKTAKRDTYVRAYFGRSRRGLVCARKGHSLATGRVSPHIGRDADVACAHMRCPGVGDRYGEEDATGLTEKRRRGARSRDRNSSLCIYVRLLSLLLRRMRYGIIVMPLTSPCFLIRLGSFLFSYRLSFTIHSIRELTCHIFIV